MEGQPEVGSPKISVLTMIKMIATNATRQNTIPITDAITSGAVEKATMPSKAYRNNFQKDHFVSPADRSIFSYSSHFFRKPTQPKIPLEKRLYSPMLKIAFTTLRFIN